MAAGDDRIFKLAAARGPVRLLRLSTADPGVGEESARKWSSSLKRRNLRCGGETAAYIARRPVHFGRLWQAA